MGGILGSNHTRIGYLGDFDVVSLTVTQWLITGTGIYDTQK